MTDKLYYKYYDKIYSKKDYQAESEVILKIAHGLKGTIPACILDVGCGTGNHDIFFAKRGCNVTGIDIDCGMVEIAQHKSERLKGLALNFLCKDVRKLESNRFDLVVSLFNVINYIDNIENIISFFKAINEQLVENGVFIFDCWNGLAAILDNPRIKYSVVETGNEIIKIHTIPHVDLMEQCVLVTNTVEVTSDKDKIENFEFEYQQTLWTPFFLKNILKMCNFNVLNILVWMQPEIKATHKNWKIMFVCQKY